MNNVRIVQVAILFTVTLALVTAQNAELASFTIPEDPERVFDAASYSEPWILGDTDGDGAVDYALLVDEFGQKRFEVVDFNFDGLMDDFYFYRDGVMVREELDTNHDGRIDLWIFMHDGVYVAGYQRDTDYDGVIDIEKDFGAN